MSQINRPPAGMSVHDLITKTYSPENVAKLVAGWDLDEIDAWLTDWGMRLRAEQLPPTHEDWDVWYLNAGRGFGKTLCGAYHVQSSIEVGHYGRVALIGPTAADVRDVMVEGPTGILSVAAERKGWRPDYQSSLRKITWPNGSEAHLYSAEEPERLRGPQHDLGWCDEIAAWKSLEATWNMYQFGLRVGPHPRTVITTTPKPLPLLKTIKRDPRTVVVQGTTFDNAKNLPDKFLNALREKYEGTRLGRQELYAEDLEEAEGALWNRDIIERSRVGNEEDLPEMSRYVVAVDPAMTAKSTSDEVGMVIGSLGFNGHGYILADTSRRMSPADTCRTAVDGLDLWKADRIVAEVNNGGDWIENGLRQVRKNVPYKSLHASRGKQARAEPVAALYEQKRVHHVGAFPELEDELCSWEPNKGLPSPNRLDALVWLITELMIGGDGMRILHVRA